MAQIAVRAAPDHPGMAGASRNGHHAAVLLYTAWVLALALAACHNLLYYGVLAKSITPCTEAVPCTLRQIEWLGFVTIPLMSLAAFAAILGCLLAESRKSRRAE